MSHPTIVIFYVENPKVSAAFFRRLLEVEPVEESPTSAMFKLSSGMMLGLWIRSEVLPAVQGVPGAAEPTVTAGDRSEVDRTLVKWRASGAVIALEPKQLDFGYGFAVRDPDGHPVRVFTPN